MRVFVCVFLGVLVCLDLACSSLIPPCETVIDGMRKMDFRRMDTDNDSIVPTADLEYAVTRFDTNCNGLISLQEYQEQVKASFQSVELVAKKLYDEMAGQTGTLTVDEMIQYVSHVDANHDGQITNEESANFWNRRLNKIYREAGLTPEGCTWCKTPIWKALRTSRLTRTPKA